MSMQPQIFGMTGLAPVPVMPPRRNFLPTQVHPDARKHARVLVDLGIDTALLLARLASPTTERARATVQRIMIEDLSWRT